MHAALSDDPGRPATVVRRQYLAAATGDLDTLKETLAADVEWTEMAGFPLGGTYRGPEAVITGVLARLAAEWDGFAAHDDTYITDGEDVVVLARYTGRHHQSGRELSVRVAHHYTVRGGKIVRFEQFVDSALVRQAMQLPGRVWACCRSRPGWRLPDAGVALSARGVEAWIESRSF